MSKLSEFRALLVKGIGETEARDIREGAAAWDLSGAADHLDEFTGGELDLASMRASRVSLPAASAPDDKSRPPRYTMSKDGRDAIIKFGKHAEKTISQIYIEDRSYVTWLVKEFSKLDDKVSVDFVDVCRNVMRPTPLASRKE